MKYIFNLFLCLLASQAIAQTAEPSDPKKPKDNSHWQQIAQNTYLSFVDPEFSLSRHHIPSSSEIVKNWTGEGWKNETIHTQLAFWSNLSKYNGQKVELVTSDLAFGKSKIKKENISLSPISYVISDDPSKLKSGCAISVILDSTLVADRIEHTNHFQYQENETRPLWLSINIPSDANAGLYTGNIKLNIGEGKSKKTLTLPYSVRVINRTLSAAKDWEFHLDLWQNPYSSARYYNVEPFSAEHFDLIRPSMKKLAAAGQKNITTTLIFDPWNSQTYDKYDSMIKWVKKKDGSWSYDYTNFDKWVNFMHEVGISKFINCYSMIPWNLSFQYFDDSVNKNEILKAKPEEDSYQKHWLPFLKDFAAHLKSKGWFDKTTIAMDERPMKDMQSATAIIKSADKDFKISLAGYYHAELSDDIIDYSIPFYSTMSDEILASRKAKGYKTTFYTCCSEIFPNTFTSSGNYEPTWLMVNAMQRGFDGYLRWSFDNFNKSPYTDTRFGPFAAGDTYLIYPNHESSIRLEKLIDGIQQVEKIKILKQNLPKESSNLIELNKQINSFSNKGIKRDLIPTQVKNLKKSLNSL